MTNLSHSASFQSVERITPSNRGIKNGIVQVLRVGCRWQDCPAAYGPPTTIYNRFHRWAGRGSGRGCSMRWLKPALPTCK
ncbi:transposase [Shinella sp.]|uniref:transposase n=1 Tax=Shinella sp. TaxID=1870904 RepID=UPI00338EBBA1|nr:transposase [Shinella sp.]